MFELPAAPLDAAPVVAALTHAARAGAARTASPRTAPSFIAPRTLDDFAALRARAARRAASSPARPTSACGSTRGSATCRRLIYVGEVDRAEAHRDARRRAARSAPARRSRTRGARSSRAGRRSTDVWLRFAVAADPPHRHDGRQRRQRLADRRLGAGADGARCAARAAPRRARCGACRCADFYIDYMKNRLEPGEFVQAIEVPLPQPRRQVRAYKISKRFDCDISAVCAGLAIELDARHGRRRALRVRRHGGDGAARARAPRRRSSASRGTRPRVAAAQARAGERLHAADRHARQRRATGCRWRRTCCSASGSRRAPRDAARRRARSSVWSAMPHDAGMGAAHEATPIEPLRSIRAWLRHARAPIDGRRARDAARASASRCRTSRRTCTSPAPRPTSTTCPSSPARCTPRSACRRWRTAASSRSTSTRIARPARRRRRARRGRHPRRRTTAARSSTTTRSSPTAWCTTSASRCSR